VPLYGELAPPYMMKHDLRAPENAVPVRCSHILASLGPTDKFQLDIPRLMLFARLTHLCSSPQYWHHETIFAARAGPMDACSGWCHPPYHMLQAELMRFLDSLLEIVIANQ
jgi:hypothetical protein